MKPVAGYRRSLALLLSAFVLIGAGVTAPAFVLADEPGVPPASSAPPSPTPVPSPSVSAAPTGAPPSTDHGPVPSPTANPAPTATPIETAAPTEPPPGTPPGLERQDLRTANSQTFEQADGSFVTEFYSEPIFWQPPGQADWQPIDVKLQPANDNGVSARAEHAPAQLDLAAVDNASGFVVLHGGGHVIRFRLPDGTPPGRAGSEPQIKDNGRFADYDDFLAGGIGLRVFPSADGFASFIVLSSRPASNVFAFEIDAPGLALVATDDGGAEFRDSHDNLVGRIPRPYMLDSSVLEGRGGGLYSDAVSMSLTPVNGPAYLLTLAVDPAFLDSAVYPVYIDPTTTDFPTGQTTADDTFASQRWPNTVLNTYQRPDSPNYHEMWHGNEPGTSYYNEVYLRFNGIETTLGNVVVDSAMLDFYPYWQYFHSDPRKSYLRRITSDWSASTLKWNLRPSVAAADDFEFYTTQGQWSGTDVTDYVQVIVDGSWTDHGVMIHNNPGGQGAWKRIVSRDDSSAYKPHLTVVWHANAPTVVYPNGTGQTSSRTLNWALPNGMTQSTYEAQIATNTGFSQNMVSSGEVTSATPAHLIPGSVSLTAGTTYYWRVRVKYTGSGSFSDWSSTASFIYNQGPTLGLPAYDTFESFALGGSDTASVNVSTGNLVITHPIVSLPIRGGSFDLGLTYNAQSSANAGTGPAWRLDAMRRLTELANGDVVLTAADGSVHTFTKGTPNGSVTPYARPATVYATLTKDTTWANEWHLVYRDQSVDEFNLVGTEGLLTRQADRFGNAVSFSYYVGTNRLQQATDPAGRVVDFAWNTGVNPPRLTSITDWAYVSSGVVQTTATGSRRVYRLFYDGSGYLIGWSDPINTAGSCPTQASHLTCLTYSNGLVATIAKTQTYTTFSSGVLGAATRTVTTQVLYRGNEVAEVQDPEQYAGSAPGTTFTRIAADRMQVVRQGTPASTTTYGYVAALDTLGRVQSVWRKLGTTDIEQRTAWDTSFWTERASVTDNYGAQLNTPARMVSYTYVASQSGAGPLVSRIVEPLNATDNRWTDYTHNANNDVTRVIVSLNGSGTTRTITRYCYTTGGDCSTSATDLVLRRVIENLGDGAKGGIGGNAADVTTDYEYDAYGQRTRETRWNYDAAGTLLDSRVTGYGYDANGNQTAIIVNFANGNVTSPGDDITPNATTMARTDLTTASTFDTAGNHVSSSDPRRAIALAQGQNLNADDYVSRFEYDALNRPTRSQIARDPADSAAPEYSTSVYDEFDAPRQTTDFGGLMNATEYDRAGRATRSFEDPDGTGGTDAAVTSVTTYDAAGRAMAVKDRKQYADSTLGATAPTYDELGRATDLVDASGSDPDLSSTTHFAFDALDRQTIQTVGYGSATAQTSANTYDLGGRAISVDDGFTCATASYDYRDLALTQTTGLDSPGCTTGASKRTVTNTYDGLGRLTRSEVTYGADLGDRTFDVTLDAAGRQLTSAVKISGVTSTTTFTLTQLDRVASAASPDGSTAKTNYDPAGSPTDRCFWTPGATVGTCYEVGHSPWSNPPTQVTTTGYDARNQRVSLSDGVSGTTTTYDPANNYQIAAFYVPTSGGHELQSLYTYDPRHRLETITHQQCTISSDHDCSTTIGLGSDSYAYDDNDNRTTVAENNGTGLVNYYYCYDALNRLTMRRGGAGCTGLVVESYTYDAAGNRLTAPGQTFTYNQSTGQLDSCASDCGGDGGSQTTISYDGAGRIDSYNGWVYSYDVDGRLAKACKSTSCAGSVDRIEFSYDGEGRRTQSKEYTAGSLTTTRDFLYHGESIVQEKTNGSVSREYVVNNTGSVIRFCDPDCTSPTDSYLVTWNGHGDALAIHNVNADGTLTLANSFRYSTWGTPTTTVAQGFGDLGFRFLYVGRHDVQWDNFSGLGLYYMHARHYAPAIGRFLQPDPARAESNGYGYTADNPVSAVDPRGTCAWMLAWAGPVGAAVAGLTCIGAVLTAAVAAVTYATAVVVSAVLLAMAVHEAITNLRSRADEVERRVANEYRRDGWYVHPQVTFPVSPVTGGFYRRYDFCVYDRYSDYVANKYKPRFCVEVKAGTTTERRYYYSTQYRKDVWVQGHYKFPIEIVWLPAW